MLKSVFQSILKYLSLLAVSEYCGQEVSDPELNEAIRQLQRPTFGQWPAFLRRAERHFRQHPPALIEELQDLFKPRRHARLRIPYLIDSLISLRNTEDSHAASFQQTREVVAGELARWTPHLEAWLDDLSWITRYPLYVRGGDNTVIRLMGAEPQTASDDRVAALSRAELFFARGDRALAAFPFFFWLETVVERAAPGLYLYNGVREKRIIYLSHLCTYEEKDAEVLARLRSLLQQKQTQLRAIVGPLTAETLVEEARRHTRGKLQRARNEQHDRPDLYVARTEIEGAFRLWRAEGGKALLLCGEAGSGKSLALYHFAERFLDEANPVLLIRGPELAEAGLEFVRSTVIKALGRVESLETILAALEEEHKELLLLVDALNENPHPAELFESLMALLAEHEGQPLRLAMSIRDVALRQNDIASSLERGRARLLHFDAEADGQHVSRPYFFITRITDLDFERFFDRYRAVYDVRSTASELDPVSSHVLRNPLLLRLACERYRGRPLPSHVSPHHLFDEFLKRTLVSPSTGRADPACVSFLRGLVRFLADRQFVQADYDELFQDDNLRPQLSSDSPNSAYWQLLQKGILAKVPDPEDLFKTSVHVTFERLFEFLLAREQQQEPVERLAERLKSGAKPAYSPAIGALSLRLLLEGERKRATAYSAIAPMLVNSNVVTAAQGAGEPDVHGFRLRGGGGEKLGGRGRPCGLALGGGPRGLRL